jgi:hypothetical protein
MKAGRTLGSGMEWRLAEVYGASPRQIRRYGVSRFMALKEDARQIIANDMRRTANRNTPKVQLLDK